ncbi:aspartate aminotransferase family protein [bacterium]|nr:aspartate aminotransferase family protein [bacterium]
MSNLEDDIFSDLSKYEARAMHGQLPVVWDKAEGATVTDISGNTWIDLTSTIFVANTGHAHPKVLSALRSVLDKPLLHTYTFTHEFRRNFLKKLIESTPEYFEKAFLLSAGTEATECAIKLSRMYGINIRKDKKAIISFRGAMHGRTLGAEMLKGDPKSEEWIGYMDPNIHHLEFPFPNKGRPSFESDIDKLLNLKKLDPKNITAIFIESYIGWGAIFFPKAYVQAIEKFAKENDILLVFDEIQSGIGRTGKFFAYEHYGVTPDLVCFGKGISSGPPLSGVIGSAKILDIPETGSMSSTHSANPLSCAAGLATLEIVEQEKLVDQARHKGNVLHSELNRIRDRFSDHISYIFGKGLVAAIITQNKEGVPDKELATKICNYCKSHGVLLVHTGRESIKIGPPLIISEEMLRKAILIIEEAFRIMCEE